MTTNGYQLTARQSGKLSGVRTSSSPKLPEGEFLRQSSLASSLGSRLAARAAPTRLSRARLSVDSASLSVSSAKMLPARPHLFPRLHFHLLQDEDFWKCMSARLWRCSSFGPFKHLLPATTCFACAAFARNAPHTSKCNAGHSIRLIFCEAHPVAACRVGTAGVDVRASASAAEVACASWCSSRSADPPSSCAAVGRRPPLLPPSPAIDTTTVRNQHLLSETLITWCICKG